MEIKGYTLHGDYYLADEVIPNKTWEEAITIKEEITLPNGKTVIAHTLSKEELETIPQKERRMRYNWYWTNTTDGDNYACFVCLNGDFYYNRIIISYDTGGARLGFKNPF